MGLHGQSKTRLYQKWANMKKRCFNKNEWGYKYYGARGITVCEEWMSYEPFRDWALKKGYKDGLSLERKNNDKNYEPSNCCWIPFSEQAKNRSTSIKYKGELAMYASIRLGGNIGLVKDRIRMHGWTVKDAFTTPVTPHKIYKNSKNQK